MRATARILVVDDDRDVLRFVCEALTEQGWETMTARNGADALALIARSRPDLVLLDMQMPIMDGWEFARAYRQTPGPHAPIVVVTVGRSSGAARAAEIGAASYLAKPFSLEGLLAAVAQYADVASPAA
jgi:CheY-like chemotaxis protein